MLTNLNPAIVFIEDKFINVENLDSFKINDDNLTIQLDYISGVKDLLRFGSIHEVKRAALKISKAQSSLDQGV